MMNTLGKHHPGSVLNTLIMELRAFDFGDIAQFQSKPPWKTLLLLRWFLERGEYSPAKSTAMSQGDFAKLINSVRDLEDVLELPSEHPSLTVFLRKLAHQQFWFQENLQVAHVARQALLFRELPPTHPLALRFEELVGASLKDFVVLLAAFTIHLAVNQVTVERRFFAPLEPYFTRSTIDAVLAAISRDRDELRTFLRTTRFDDLRTHYEYYARTPLTRYPLLRKGSLYIPYSSTVLARGAETLVYDILREADASTFMNHFGALFELYVRRGVEHIGEPFMDEVQLKQRYGDGKVVDFAFSYPHGTLLIDAKGVELPIGALVTREVEFLSSRLANSVFKALEQADELSIRMKLPEAPYVLVVTYKDFLLGNGSDLLTYADAAQLPKSVSRLDMSRVYFCSIEEFDYLAAGLRSHQKDPVTFFATARDLDADPRTKAFTMMQRINSDLRPYGTPDYLKAEQSALMDILQEALPSP